MNAEIQDDKEAEIKELMASINEVLEDETLDVAFSALLTLTAHAVRMSKEEYRIAMVESMMGAVANIMDEHKLSGPSIILPGGMH